MLARIDRLFVQVLRSARDIRITVNYGCSDELTVRFASGKQDIKKLTHDVALAVQDHLNKASE